MNLGVNNTLTTFDKNTQAAPRNHDIVEIESIGESLGSKYYEFNSKDRNLVDAEDKINEKSNAISNKHIEKMPESPGKDKVNQKIQNAPKKNEKSKLEAYQNKNNVNADKNKKTNLRVKSEETSLERQNTNPDTNSLKVQKIRILSIRRMGVTDDA